MGRECREGDVGEEVRLGRGRILALLWTIDLHFWTLEGWGELLVGSAGSFLLRALAALAAPSPCSLATASLASDLPRHSLDMYFSRPVSQPKLPNSCLLVPTYAQRTRNRHIPNSNPSSAPALNPAPAPS